jgi:hypothetical protein
MREEEQVFLSFNIGILTFCTLGKATNRGAGGMINYQSKI